MDDPYELMEMETLDEADGYEWEDEADGYEWEASDQVGETLYQQAPPRPRGGTITMPPTVIRVRPAMVLDRFLFNKATLTPRHRLQLQRVARAIVASWRPGGRPIRAVRLVGHTDNRGPLAYNHTLGLNRARAVAHALRMELARLVRAHRGGPRLRALRIVPQSMGERRPAASNATPAGRARNRRVQLFLIR